MLYSSPILGATSTMERLLSLNQIAVSDDFPSDEFDAVSGKLGSTYGERYEYRVFVMDALNAIAYRFTALAEYDESLRSNGTLEAWFLSSTFFPETQTDEGLGRVLVSREADPAQRIRAHPGVTIELFDQLMRN